MFERFTEKAIRVVTLAQEEAVNAKHNKLYPEHILLGILALNTGIAARFLKASGLSPELLRPRVNQIVKQYSSDLSTSDILPFSSAVKRILKDAWDSSKTSGSNYVNPEHLFLAMLKETGSDITALLEEFDVDVNRIKTSISKMVEKKATAAVHPENSTKQPVPDSKQLEVPIIYEEKEMIELMNSAKRKLTESSHEILGTEQILLAMLDNKNLNIASILETAGVTYDKFSDKLRHIHSREAEYDKISYLYTPSAQRAINTAYEISKEFGSAEIKPEHILLGILKEKRGIAYNILRDLGISNDYLSESIIQPIEKQKPATLTVIRLAKEEARRLSYHFMGTEMILLGLLGEGTGIAARVLQDLGVTLKDARTEVEKLIGASVSSSDKDITFTPRAKKVLELGWEKAKKYSCQRIETEHLLLSITAEKECMAMKVLSNLGVDALEIRQGILQHINEKNNNTGSSAE